MKNIVMGVLAHVDAGKTTLTEGILQKTGVIKEAGKVDDKNTFLDNNDMERARGITIFSKQATFQHKDTCFDLLDTPGHVDFSAEMERTLQVLDYALLVVSGADEIFGHTLTLWKLLRDYNIPTFIFVNKMDRMETDRERIFKSLREELSTECIDFSMTGEQLYEEIAACSDDENLLDRFLESGRVDVDDITELIYKRKIYPVMWGSALKQQGVAELLDIISEYTKGRPDNGRAAARVYKITRDEKGNRLTHVKILGGSFSVRDELLPGEKISQIRMYNGEKYEVVQAVGAGRICSFLGADTTYAGQGIGDCEDMLLKHIEPVLQYELILPDELSERQFYPKLRELEEELPELKVLFDENIQRIKIMIMGPVQIEILTGLIKERYGFVPTFGPGAITYKETIAESVIGVGHFEPLRHYAEVHLLIEPARRGAGITVNSSCREEVLDKNWQRLIMTHVMEKKHKGVLTGSELTDVTITVISGRAHTKHTEGGDFRNATYRAVRQGLMEAETVLLEPYYSFVLELPYELLGKAMTDVEQMHGSFQPPRIDDTVAVLSGRCPVATMNEYQLQLNAYTHGKGKLAVNFDGYDRCHNTDEVVALMRYNPDEDEKNPSSSVFCAMGAGYIVPWYEVKEKMHVIDEAYEEKSVSEYVRAEMRQFDYSIGADEIDEIINRTYNSNAGRQKTYKKLRAASATNTVYKTTTHVNNNRKKLLLVDGYNVIFANEELKTLAELNLDSAKDRLISILSNYKGMTELDIRLIFDGYKVKEGKGSEVVVEDITVIHTKENQTADAFIELFTNENKEKYEICVATSDGLIQQITRGQNCYIISSRELMRLIEEKTNEFRQSYEL